MTKTELLKKLHSFARVGYDSLSYNDIERLHSLIRSELEAEEKLGNVKLTRLANGHFKQIEISRPEGK